MDASVLAQQHGPGQGGSEGPKLRPLLPTSAHGLPAQHVQPSPGGRKELW